eukprot:199181-Pyramimonas_sp.AAC.1
MNIILDPKLLNYGGSTDSPPSSSPVDTPPATDIMGEFDNAALMKSIVDYVGKSRWKQYDNWRKLRPVVKRSINTFYACAGRTDDDDLADDADAAAAPEEPVDKKGDAKLAKQLQEQGMEWKSLKNVLKIMGAKPGLVSSMPAMLSNNAVPPKADMTASRIIQLAKRMHKAYSVESSALFRCLADSSNNNLKKACGADNMDTAIINLVEIIGNIIFETIDADAITLLRDFYHGTGGGYKDKVRAVHFAGLPQDC